MSHLDTDIKFVKGIGEKRAQLFKKRLGLFTLRDLIEFYPRQYEDWTNPYRIADVPLGETVCVRAKIASEIEKGVTRNRKINTYTFYVYDRTGQIRIVIYNRFLPTNLNKGEEYLFYGKVKWSGTYREMSSPEIRPVTESKLRPIYHATEGLTSRQIERIMSGLIGQIKIDECLPENILAQNALISHETAVRQIHLPSTKGDVIPARKRLAFEELLFLRLGLTGLKNRARGTTAKPITPLSHEQIDRLFPFPLTGAQKRVIMECMRDMQGTVPMNRLIQGDVGSGKTAVATALCHAVKQSGYMSVLLAPTELLAVQHHATIQRFFADFGYTVRLLTGGLTAKQKREIKAELQAGTVDILVATHAVLTEDVSLPDTALIITDEQHRFGVGQRAILSQKAEHPHTLVMSATPIPRTMGLVVYGDLDISIIDEIPAGRSPIKSYAVPQKLRERAIGYVKKHIDQGFQGYIVCPMVEADTESELISATAYAEKLRNSLLQGYSVGLLHGKMKPKEKDAVMRDFADGKIQVLVSTTVIEVGIDVPNAVIMVVENAERFGLSQLHQLRGRVGRGTAESSCIFISDAAGETATQRLRTLCETTDGFKIAEADLKLRGPGNFLGKEQHGLPKLKIADLIDDQALLRASALAAEEILSKDPTLSKPEHHALKEQVNRLFSEPRRIEFN